VDVENDENMSNYTAEADFSYVSSADQLRIRSIKNIAFFTGVGAFDSTYGYIMTPSLFRPTADNHATLGSADNRWNTLFTQNVQGTNNVNITATDGNTQTSTLALGSDGSLALNDKKVSIASSSYVNASNILDFNVQQYAFGARISNNIISIHQYISDNSTHSSGDLLMTFKAGYRPLDTIRIPFVGYNGANVFGYIKITSNGQCTIDSINDSTVTARICFGGCMWFMA
jgi:hypothetical protein